MTLPEGLSPEQLEVIWHQKDQNGLTAFEALAVLSDMAVAGNLKAMQIVDAIDAANTADSAGPVRVGSAILNRSLL